MEKEAAGASGWGGESAAASADIKKLKDFLAALQKKDKAVASKQVYFQDQQRAAFNSMMAQGEVLVSMGPPFDALDNELTVFNQTLAENQEDFEGHLSINTEVVGRYLEVLLPLVETAEELSGQGPFDANPERDIAIMGAIESFRERVGYAGISLINFRNDDDFTEPWQDPVFPESISYINDNEITYNPELEIVTFNGESLESLASIEFDQATETYTLETLISNNSEEAKDTTTIHFYALGNTPKLPIEFGSPRMVSDVIDLGTETIPALAPGQDLTIGYPLPEDDILIDNGMVETAVLVIAEGAGKPDALGKPTDAATWTVWTVTHPDYIGPEDPDPDFWNTMETEYLPDALDYSEGAILNMPDGTVDSINELTEITCLDPAGNELVLYGNLLTEFVDDPTLAPVYTFTPEDFKNAALTFDPTVVCIDPPKISVDEPGVYEPPTIVLDDPTDNEPPIYISDPTPGAIQTHFGTVEKVKNRGTLTIESLESGILAFGLVPTADARGDLRFVPGAGQPYTRNGMLFVPMDFTPTLELWSGVSAVGPNPFSSGARMTGTALTGFGQGSGRDDFFALSENDEDDRITEEDRENMPAGKYILCVCEDGHFMTVKNGLPSEGSCKHTCKMFGGFSYYGDLKYQVPPPEIYNSNWMNP